MSIPPLVCSTPPPPDQCEDDDKDPEDFDLPYNLSQEDEENEDNTFGYGNFSSYNNFQTAHANSIQINDLPRNTDNEVLKETHDLSLDVKQKSSTSNLLREDTKIKLKCEEDINIEDLNLELDEGLSRNIEFDNDKTELNENDNSLKEVCEASETSIREKEVNINSINHDQNVIDSLNIVKELAIDLDKVTDEQFPEENIISEVHLEGPSQENVESVVGIEEGASYTEESSKEPIASDTKSNKVDIDDDFGDFEDFQFDSNEKKITSVVNNFVNPWKSDEVEDSEFGNFTANFEETEFNAFLVSETDDTPGPQEYQSKIVENKHTHHAEENDDFGDFDDFKSSSFKKEPTDSTLQQSNPCEDVPVLNLHLTENEHQIMESISKVLTSIFVEELTEPVTDFQGKLESLLSETWRHLMQTDERQPYIVHWNNSLGQKTLLKSLCIDSRNILFGPKWNTNMPKYAANLTAAPLQPQKPLTPSNASHNETGIDKTSSKHATWSDPFTSDGQESCNTETQSASSTTGPTDLDVFEAAMSTKSDKIYSSTLNVQPLRQINLPDTHIFTPSDSETPRSKTIHYDCSPAVLLPQPAMNDGKEPTDVASSSGEIVGNDAEDDSEYWEFQGFQSNSSTRGPQAVHEVPVSSESNFQPESSSSQKPSVPFQIQPLQPIKVEPTLPTLNWPEPGEVKGAFDDFSDFVAVSQNAEKESVVFELPVFQAAISNNVKSENLPDLNVKTEYENKGVGISSSQELDDDFDTFKSALPSNHTNEFDVNNLGTSANKGTPSTIADFDYAFPNSNNFKSETISFPTTIRPNEALTQNLGNNISNIADSANKISLPSGKILHTSVLQPTPASFSAPNAPSHQKSGQILQPLSLESYSQINWPSPGIDLQDLSRFNPVETLESLKSDLSAGGLSKGSSPVHSQKSNSSQVADDDVWGEFVSSKPKPQTSFPKKPAMVVDDDEWTDFISSPSSKPQNGLNTISLNVHTNSNIQKTALQSKLTKSQTPLDIPTLNYITPKSTNAKSYNDRHFQNL